MFNNKKSIFDCLVRDLSPSGACLQVNSSNGLPQTFDLLIDGESAIRPCRLIWLTDTRAGIEFDASNATGGPQEPLSTSEVPKRFVGSACGDELVHDQLLTLRVALDLVPVGIVLLDANTRAQFINRAFRRMWRLSDEKAESRPPFVALMYHGRDTMAYSVPSGDLDAHVAERVAYVKSGNPKPLDLRLANGEVIRVQWTVLPSGGRMLCYTYVTDIVRDADELGMLRSALDQMQPGIILLDGFLNAQFMNRAVRKLWSVADDAYFDETSAFRGARKPDWLRDVLDEQGR